MKTMRSINSECPFCNKETIQDSILHEVWGFMVVKNIKPLVEGHIMVIPERHIRTEIEFDPSEKSGYWQACDWAYRYVKRKSGIEPMIFVNAKQDQSVYHYHKHYVPGVFGVHGVDNALRKVIADLE